MLGLPVAPAPASCWPGLTGLWPCAESAFWLPHSQVGPSRRAFFPGLSVHCSLCPSFSVLPFPARVPMARETGVDSRISGVGSGNSVFRMEILYLCSHLIGLPQPWQETSNGCRHPIHTLDLQCPVAASRLHPHQVRAHQGCCLACQVLDGYEEMSGSCSPLALFLITAGGPTQPAGKEGPIVALPWLI